MSPLLSVVIANFNYGRFLGDAISSLVTQDGFDECELIVVDGGSTDNSVEVIRKFADRISWWCSEKDNGQSEAFNKGFEKARGKYLTWLNADDLLVKGCLRKILTQLKKHPECEWFTGNMLRFIEDTGKISELSIGPHCYPRILQQRDSPLVIYGPTSFFSKRIYQLVGGIDERLHYNMDTDLWLSFMDHGIIKRRINCLCWMFRLHEASKTSEYGDHKIDWDSNVQGKKDVAVVLGKHRFTTSKLLWFLISLVRIVDGSYIRQCYFRQRYLGRDYRSFL